MTYNLIRLLRSGLSKGRIIYMVLCDRCKKELSYKERENATTQIIHYKAAGAYIGKYVDLCPECKRLRDDFLTKMDSFFMINEDPMKILEDKVYWRQNI